MATVKRQIKNYFTASEAVKSPTGIKPAKQEFKDDADLNSIMRKFQKTGSIDHVKNHQPQYGESTPQTLHEALNVVKRADSMFADLPSSVRNKFHNKPEAFLEFVQDPANLQEAQELGLALSTQAAEQAAHEAGTPSTPDVVEEGVEPIVAP